MRTQAVLSPPQTDRGHYLNDVHAKLNPTRVARIVEAHKIADVQRAVRQARRDRLAISVAGGRHAMGGQQFGEQTLHLDTRGLRGVGALDSVRGLIDVEAGVWWPELIRRYHVLQARNGVRWGIAQKQTGADRLSVGGAIAANIHGRGLRMRPFIQDVESLTLVDARGERVHCSRQRNPELFSLAIGGYGLFGIVVSARLRLVPRRVLERVVELRPVDGLINAFSQRIAQGHLYGDFQFDVDPDSKGFLRDGVFASYRPVPAERPIPANQIRLSKRDWGELLLLAHIDKSAAFRRFADFYQRSSGQLYWSDTLQLSIYLDDYHEELDHELGAGCRGTEMITELFVPRPRLERFLGDCRRTLRMTGADLIYGTIRLIERDEESLLAWARDDWACVIFNLHTEHTPRGLKRAAQQFRRLIDDAVRHDGSYYLTYHRWASRRQIEACHPRFRRFLELKRHYDPDGLFQSDWYRYHLRLFGDT